MSNHSPLAPFANCRILWYGASTRTSGRDGMKLVPGQAYLIRAFLRRIGREYRMEKSLGLPAVEGLPMPFHGYCTAYAPITNEQAAEYRTIDLLTITGWDYSAFLPPGVEQNAQAKLSIPGTGELDIRFLMRSGRYGSEGIGEIIRNALGDELYIDGGMLG